MSITVIGTIFVDIKGYPLSSFIPNGRNPGYMKYVHGGVARNVAEDLGRLGLYPKFAALTDRSALAADVVARLKTSGVDTRFIGPSDAGMGTWMAIFDDTGDVAANISIRPDLSPLTGLLSQNQEELFGESDGIILEIDIEEETVGKVFQYAEKYDKKVYAVVSVMRIALERRKYFPRTECFICNLQEAEMLFEENLSALPLPDLQKRIAGLARAEGFSKLIVTLGAQGAVYADCRKTDSGADTVSSGYCPAQKVTLLDSTGAGDAFCAGASAALMKGADLTEACKTGSALAASVLTSTENVCPEELSGLPNL